LLRVALVINHPYRISEMRGRSSSASEKTRGSLIAQANQRDSRSFSAVRRRNRDSLHERYVHLSMANC